MNRIVFRYADVLLERAEAYAQLGNTTEAMALVNQIRLRAGQQNKGFNQVQRRREKRRVQTSLCGLFQSKGKPLHCGRKYGRRLYFYKEGGKPDDWEIKNAGRRLRRRF